jgi:hypothetical protein
MEDSRPFSIRLFARWSDMDFNQHMKNAAYLGASEDCRSVVLWLDLEARRAVVPPDELAAVWIALARASDFEWYLGK